MQLESLIHQYATTLYAVAIGRKSRHMSVDEAKQIVLIELWKYSLDPKEVDNLGAYLNKIVSRRTMNAARPYTRYYGMNENYVVEDFWSLQDKQDLETDYIREETERCRRKAVEGLLRGLPRDLGVALGYKLKGLTNPEIASLEGITAPAASERVIRGKNRLIEAIGELG